jgi:hypothetical protein
MITALTTAVLIIFMAQFIREGIFPFPTGMDSTDRNDIILWMKKMPTKGYVILAVSHALAMFSASFITSLTVGRRRMTLGVTSMCVILIPVIFYAYIHKLPMMFIAIDTCSMIIVGFIGALIGSNRYDI